MTLLEYAKETLFQMNKIQSGEEFAKFFVARKCECFLLFGKGTVTSTSHGLEYFQNIIKYWECPTAYKKLKEKAGVDYEYNFVQMLIENKKICSRH